MRLTPVDWWGRAHWSLYLKLEQRFARGEHRVEFSLDMRQGRRNFELLASRLKNCTKVVRAKIMKPEMGSTLRSGETLRDHDDWDCVSDMIGAGLIEHGNGTGELRPGLTISFTPLGLSVLNQLKAHKVSRGQFSAFVPVLKKKST